MQRVSGKKLEDVRRKIPIQFLPEKIDLEESVKIAYSHHIEWIVSKLRQDISVLVSCDKILTDYIISIIKSQKISEKTEVTLFGIVRNDEQNQFAKNETSYIEILLNNLKKTILSLNKNSVLKKTLKTSIQELQKSNFRSKICCFDN